MQRRPQIHEWLYLALGAALVVALLWRGVPNAVLLVTAITASYALLLSLTRCGGLWRLVAAYAVTWALYAGSAQLVEWLQVPLRHGLLLGLDVVLFGQSPAVTLQGRVPWPLQELMAVGYLSYHVYLHWVWIEALRRDDSWRAGLSARLFTAFSVGFVGYLAFPAAPPGVAFPELFTQPLGSGYFTRANEAINASLAARYDAFPSLHVLITVTLLAWDWRNGQRRFWLMIGPALLMLAATLALRLHYAVDLLASALLFAMLHLIHVRFLSHSRRPLGT